MILRHGILRGLRPCQLHPYRRMTIQPQFRSNNISHTDSAPPSQRELNSKLYCLLRINTTHRCTIRRRKRAGPYARDPSSPDRHRCPRHNNNNDRNAAGRITGLILQHRHPTPDPLRLLQSQAPFLYIRCHQSIQSLHRFRRRGCAARQGFSHG